MIDYEREPGISRLGNMLRDAPSPWPGLVLVVGILLIAWLVA
jgi:hypothetical protein